MKTILLLLLFALPVAGHTQNMPTTIKVQGMEMANAMMKNDFNTFVKYLHPNIIAFAGGKDRLKARMDSAAQAMRQFGASFKRYWIGDPGKIVTHNNQLQALLPESTTLRMGISEVTIETTVIVTSDDGGKHWYFTDTNVYHADKLKGLLPDLSPQLVIPPRKKPEIVRVDNQAP